MLGDGGQETEDPPAIGHHTSNTAFLHSMGLGEPLGSP